MLLEQKTSEGTRTAVALMERIYAQFAEAFDVLNIYFYNINHSWEKRIEVCSPSMLSSEQKERLVDWYVHNGGAVGFAQRRSALEASMASKATDAEVKLEVVL